MASTVFTFRSTGGRVRDDGAITRFGGSAISAQSPVVSARSTARRLLASCSGVTAPDNTTSTQEFDNAAAIATTPGDVRWASAYCFRRETSSEVFRSVRRPLATASLMITPNPEALASANAMPAEGSRTFQVG